MGADCLTRPARPADLEAIARIEADSFGDPWPADAFRTYLGGCFLVAEEAGAVLGYLVARTAGDEAEVLDVAVDPAARGRGIGRALLADALRGLRERGARRAYLEVRESNTVALGLYQSLGFRPVGRRRGYYRQPTEDALVLARDVAPDA
jgi:ribosomal-protein-alanine N-acetyltransferase